MSVIYYTAVRSITVSGHVIGANYDFTCEKRALNPRTNTVKSESVSISGYTQTVIDRRESLWDFETDHLQEGTEEYEYMYEFLESVDEGEVFVINITGGVGDTLYPSILTSNYTRTRVEQTDEWIFNFSFRVLPG